MKKSERVPADAVLQPSMADVALTGAFAAAAAAYSATQCGPLRGTVAIIAAGRAAAEHLARAFNEPDTVNLLAALAVEAARCGGTSRADLNDLPF